MATRPRRLTYRPYLDGLRTVAVYLVVAFHAGLGKFTGGFIGVDVFFVLSGFLVTRILMRDLVSRGRIEWRRFYSRRVRRILPAAVVMLVVTAIAYAIVATPLEMFDALGGFRAAFFYVANWYFIHQATDYFATNVNTNPVVHFWSLAVEEQFYLLWPLLLGGLYVVTGRAGRWRWWVLRAVIGVAALVSVIEALHIGATNLDRAYFGTDTRAYQLLFGAVLALTPQLMKVGAQAARRLQWFVPVALAAMIVLGTSWITMSAITRGVWVAIVTFALIVALDNAPGGVTKAALSSAPMTYLGRISYGTYLWHWPVIVIAAHDRDISPVPMFVLSTVVSTLLAAASFQLIEHPIRVSQTLDRFRTPVIAIGFTSSILIGALLMPVVLDTGKHSVTALSATGDKLSLLDWRVAKKDIPKEPECLGKPVDVCTVAKGTGRHVLLMGDSNARMWIPTFDAIAKKENWTFSVVTLPGCPWQSDLQYFFANAGVRTNCQRHQKDWYDRVIPTLKPDIAIVVNQAFDDPAGPLPLPRFFLPTGKEISNQSPEFEQAIKDATAAAIAKLKVDVGRVVILEPIPFAPHQFDPVSCLSEGSAPEDCAYQANKDATKLELYYRSLGDDKTIWSLDLDKLVCPNLPTCDAVVKDIIVKRDGGHLTATFAESIAGDVDDLLHKQGVLAAAK